MPNSLTKQKQKAKISALATATTKTCNDHVWQEIASFVFTVLCKSDLNLQVLTLAMWGWLCCCKSSPYSECIKKIKMCVLQFDMTEFKFTVSYLLHAITLPDSSQTFVDLSANVGWRRVFGVCMWRCLKKITPSWTMTITSECFCYCLPAGLYPPFLMCSVHCTNGQSFFVRGVWNPCAVR